MKHRNVPVELAARYIGMSSKTIYSGLQDRTSPFGHAVLNRETNTWTYHISPGLLIRYERGELPAYNLREVMDIVAEGVEQIVNAKLSNLKKMMELLAS